MCDMSVQTILGPSSMDVGLPQGEPALGATTSPKVQPDAGEPVDRRKAWEARAKEAGLKRVNLWVPADEAALMVELKTLLMSGNQSAIDDLKQFFRATYEEWMNDRSEPPADRAFARFKFLELGGELPEGEA